MRPQLSSRGRGGRAAAAVAASLLLAAPAAADDWFEAYEKGLKALKQRQASQAVEHLERAINKRPEPGNNVITYGTNTLDRYHPYLRLAEAQLLAGNPEVAREALQRSQARGKEPAEERARIAALVEQAIEKARAASAAPPPTTLTAAPAPVPLPVPATLAAAPPTPAPPSLAPVPTAPPRPPATAAPGAVAGTLDLRSEPPGATVLVEGRFVGVTPLKVDLAPGLYPVTLRKEGSADQTFTVRIDAARRTVESRTLVATGPPPAPTPTAAAPAPVELATLEVYSDPHGASVYLDDEPIGATDPGTGRLVKTGVSPGSHRLRLSRAGRQEVAQEVTVAESGPTTLRVGLPELPPSRVPMMAAIAGAVVAVGGAVAFLVRRRAVPPRETVTLPRAATPAGATPVRGRSGTARLGTTPPSRRPTVVSPATLPEASQAVLPEMETRGLSGGVSVKPGGDWFGPYRLLEPLGKGGMATVYKAERSGEIFALKRPLAAFLEDPEFLQRFLREAEIGRTLHHPNIIRIFERGEVESVPYFTMELVKGETLQAYVRRSGALGPKEATKVIAQVAEALDYAHLKGVVHRDLKPSNIMILEDGTVKVMDYGIARARRFEGLTVTGAFLGTPDYVAPETAEGRGTDGRSDLYSLGIVFYEILTGKKPFVGETPFATLRKHCTEPPTPPSVISPNVPRELEAIILKLLCKSPEDRYPGAEELLIALRDYLNRAA